MEAGTGEKRAGGVLKGTLEGTLGQHGATNVAETADALTRLIPSTRP